jgi:hypothetical protein
MRSYYIFALIALYLKFLHGFRAILTEIVLLVKRKLDISVSLYLGLVVVDGMRYPRMFGRSVETLEGLIYFIYCSFLALRCALDLQDVYSWSSRV